MNAWEAYTPTLTQSATVTKTVTSARYTRIGRTIIGQFSLAVTGAGTVTNTVKVGLPVAAQSAVPNVGSVWLFDSSTSTAYSGELIIGTGAQIVELYGDWSASSAWGITPNLALASGDLLRGSFMYEAAS